MNTVKIYRLYTESIGDESVSDNIMRANFSGYTKYVATGIWRRLEEKTIVYEMIFFAPTFNQECTIWNDLQRASAEIKQKNKQESVLITITKGEGSF